MFLFLSFLLFFLGTSVGSFLSVFIHRLHFNQKGILWGRSHCPFCKKQLSFIDLIPLVSYVVLGGKCRKCHKKISPHYFFLELISGIIFFFLFIKFPFLNEAVTGNYIDLFRMSEFLFGIIIGTILIGIFFYDLKYLEIPDLLLLPFIGISFLNSIIFKTTDLTSMAIAAVIALIFFGGQIVLSKGQWLGEGDLLIGIGMALLFGWQLFLVTLVLMYVSGAVISLTLLIKDKANMKSKIPFAPFMVLAAFITLFLGPQILNYYSQNLILF